MPVSTRFGLWAVAIAVTLASGACGDDKEKNSDGTGGADASAGGTGGADAGLIEIANLDDNVSGSFCMTSGDCKGKGATCVASTCTGFCESNKNCGAGGNCVQPVAGQVGSCSKVCKTNADCSGGLECREGANLSDILDDLTSAIADAGISVDLDAGVEVKNLPKTCGESLGTVSLPDGVVGKACSDNGTCAPGECAANINIAERFPAGYCTGKCLKDSECGAGGVCYKDPVSAALKLEGRCLLGCSTSASCRAGQVCRSSMFIDAKTYCLPPEPDAGTAGGSGDAGASDASVTHDS